MKKGAGTVLSGIMLITIFLFPFLKAFLTTAVALHESGGFSWGQWLQFALLDIKINLYATMGYFGLESIFDRINFRHAAIMNYAGLFVRYLLLMSSFAMLPLGAGVLMRRGIFRAFSVIALSIMLGFGLINILGRYILFGLVALPNVLSVVFFGGLLFHLTRRSAREGFE